MSFWRRIIMAVIIWLTLTELYEELSDDDTVNGIVTHLESLGLNKWVEQFQTWHDQYLEFHDWLDEVLPPGDSYWLDDDEESEDDYENGKVTIQLLDQSMGSNNSDYFTMSKVPRRARPSKVCSRTSSNPKIILELPSSFSLDNVQSGTSGLYIWRPLWRAFWYLFGSAFWWGQTRNKSHADLCHNWMG